MDNTAGNDGQKNAQYECRDVTQTQTIPNWSENGAAFSTLKQHGVRWYSSRLFWMWLYWLRVRSCSLMSCSQLCPKPPALITGMSRHAAPVYKELRGSAQAEVRTSGAGYDCKIDCISGNTAGKTTIFCQIFTSAPIPSFAIKLKGKLHV